VNQLKRALITCISGQDGSYLAELLTSKSYEVHGVVRRSSSFNTQRLDPIYKDPHEANARLILHYRDLADGVSLTNLIRDLQPHEIYHLGAQSHVRVSFDIPEYTAQTTGLGTLRILEAIVGCPDAVLSGVLVGDVRCRATTTKRDNAVHPRSPYGAAKVFAYWVTVNFREAYGLFTVNGLLFNHVVTASKGDICYPQN
jgi:GDPmannose 4,6-dehydratase